MTRNEALRILSAHLANAPGSELIDTQARKVYAAAYDDASRNLIRALANAGAFEDGRNLDDRMPPRVSR